MKINKVKNLIDSHGGVGVVSTKAGVPRKTVESWISRRRIPAKRVKQLVEIGMPKAKVVAVVLPDDEDELRECA